MTDTTTTESRARQGVAGRLALALDVESLDAALALARPLTRYFAIAKVGLELFSAAGPRAVEALREEGFEIFVDLKLHDIPTTVERAATVLGGLGVRFVTVHTQGGLVMCRAAATGLSAGAAKGGHPQPVGLGVTVLTSDAQATEAVLVERASLAAAAGLGGLVCAAPDLSAVRRAAPGLVTVVPGTRPAGSSANDQSRVATPAEALSLGADILVIGRAVTHAEDPVAAAEALCGDLGEGATER